MVVGSLDGSRPLVESSVGPTRSDLSIACFCSRNFLLKYTRLSGGLDTAFCESFIDCVGLHCRCIDSCFSRSFLKILDLVAVSCREQRGVSEVILRGVLKIRGVITAV